MIRPANRFRLVLTIVVVAGCAGAAPGQAAVFSGSNLAVTPNSSICLPNKFGDPPASCTLALSALPPSRQAGGGVLAAIPGVVVEWRMRMDVSEVFGPPDGSVRLRIV